MANAAYNPLGLYMSCVDEAPEPLTALPTTITRTQGLQQDAAGIPQTMIGPSLQYHPAIVSRVGLQDWAEYVRFKDLGRLGEGIQLADWLVNWQNKETGVFEHKYALSPVAGVSGLTKGWGSAYSQGMAMSFLARMGILIGGERGNKYLDAATLAIKPFYVDSSKGGLRTILNKRVWFETFPTTPSNYELPGFLFSLVGLNDLAVITGNKQAKTLYGVGRETLRKNIQLFDWPEGRVLSHLAHTMVPGQQPVFSTPGSQGWVGTTVLLLKQLNCMDSEPELSRWIKRWERYAQRNDEQK